MPLVGPEATVGIMKKTILATTVAASLAVTAVPAPALAENANAPAQADSETVQSGDTAEAPESADDANGSSLSPGAIAGITLGVLALVGGGAFFAVRQGLITVPGADELARALNLPPLPGRATPAPQRGSCAPGEFDALVPDWPHFTGTVVMYCDGQWAQAGANQTDWTEAFRFADGRWHHVKPHGTSYTGFKCYNGITLREQGAPEEFLDTLVICRPEDINR